MAISTRVLDRPFSLNYQKSHPKSIQEEFEELNFQIRELMKRVLFCEDLRSFSPIISDINICLKQIECISEKSLSPLRSNTIDRRDKWFHETIHVLFTNIYLVKHHSSRIQEFIELSRNFDQLIQKIIRLDQYRDFSSSTVQDIAKKFEELALSFFAIREGLAICPLIGDQKGYFVALECKHRTLKSYIKALDL
jgi:hypothetical protein